MVALTSKAIILEQKFPYIYYTEIPLYLLYTILISNGLQNTSHFTHAVP